MGSSLRLGIDIGGTFTDFVAWDPETGGVTSFKLLSSPSDPGLVVLEGLQSVLGEHRGGQVIIVHGSTVATNALLERKGARTALVATAGFGDLLQIGRQNRPALYDLFADPLSPLVPPSLRFEVAERIDRDGNVLQPPDVAALASLGEKLKAAGAESVAVCLLFSFANPAHEELVCSRLEDSGLSISASHEILPEFREYERASTTTVNAYVSPLLEGYLGRLESALHEVGRKGRGEVRKLLVMQSNGGTISPTEAAKSGVRCILSGPAGGVIGCQHVASQASDLGDPNPKNGQRRETRLITFDMGGTSTDVSLISGQPGITTESVIGGCPIRVPMLDVHTIGAGGGSIARVDAGGALRVGPDSAGADPGPACYARHLDTPPLATVTDANLVLGRLAPERFLGGQMALSSERSWQAFTALAAQLRSDPEKAALGVLRVVNAHMERALRVISVERGYDPRDFTLLSFGGAGGLHCAELARSLGIRAVLVPPLASTLSAFGMLAADVVKDYTQTVMRVGTTDVSELENRLAEMMARGRREIEGQGVSEARIAVEGSLDMRYAGQSYELTIPFKRDFRSAFHAAHQHAYGFSLPEAEVEIVNLRVRATGATQPPRFAPAELGPASPADAYIARRPVVFPDRKRQTRFYAAELLKPGNHIRGPAVVTRADTTVLVGPQDAARVDAFGNLLLDISAS